MLSKMKGPVAGKGSPEEYAAQQVEDPDRQCATLGEGALRHKRPGP